METSTATARSIEQTIVQLPTYTLLPTAILKAVDNAASVLTSSSDDLGELFGIAVATKVAAEDVVIGSVVIIPFRNPGSDEVIDFSFVASSPQLYVTLKGTPQIRMSYGVCTAYSNNCPEFPVDVGTAIKFPSPSHFLVAKGDLTEALSAAVKTSSRSMEPQIEEGQKRQCIRQLDEVGEQPEPFIDKGTSKYLLDLEGVRHFTRVKTDVPQREKDLFFVFRAMDRAKWEYAMGNDLTLQAEEFRLTLVEQGMSRNSSRIAAFSECSMLDRIQKLEFAVKTTKTKLLLSGIILVEGTSETLTLEDFTSGERILSEAIICPNHNRALIAVLRNVKMVLEIVFSSEFHECLAGFIHDLEGTERPMELVASDFMLFSVESALRKFFRVIRSVRTTEKERP